MKICLAFQSNCILTTFLIPYQFLKGIRAVIWNTNTRINKSNPEYNQLKIFNHKYSRHTILQKIVQFITSFRIMFDHICVTISFMNLTIFGKKYFHRPELVT